MEVELADMLPDGWRHWLHWEELLIAHGLCSEENEDAQVVRTDGGRRLGFTRVIARRPNP